MTWLCYPTGKQGLLCWLTNNCIYRTINACWQICHEMRYLMVWWFAAHCCIWHDTRICPNIQLYKYTLNTDAFNESRGEIWLRNKGLFFILRIFMEYRRRKPPKLWSSMIQLSKIISSIIFKVNLWLDYSCYSMILQEVDLPTSDYNKKSIAFLFQHQYLTQ